MTLREIFRFELLYQARRARTWLYFAVLLAVSYPLTGDRIEKARAEGSIVNSPFAIASTTVITSLLWILIATNVAGSAAARDVKTRMYPLVYTTPIRKAEYLGGRFLAAFVLNAAILLAVPLSLLLSVSFSGLERDIVAPFRPAAYLSAYALIAVPSAFAGTAVQFSFAVLSRRAVVSYLGSLGLGIGVSIVSMVVSDVLGRRTLGMLLDPLGYMTVLGYWTWTQTQKETILVALQGGLLANRLVWIAIGLAVLAVTHHFFRLEDGGGSTKPRARSATA